MLIEKIKIISTKKYAKFVLSIAFYKIK